MSDSAFPQHKVAFEKRIGSMVTELVYGPLGGLTKRELFAALMAQSIVSTLERGIRPEHVQALMGDAVLLADALIAALAPTSSEPNAASIKERTGGAST